MKTEKTNNYIKLEHEYFNLDNTFACGQTFRWKKQNDTWIGIIGEHIFKLIQKDDHIEIKACHEDDFDTILWSYFDFDTDYEKINQDYKKNIHINYVINNVKGLRVLNQPRFECLISFMISANNNMPRILASIDKISKKYGKHIEGDFYSFPTAEQLSAAGISDYKSMGLGYRAEYVYEAVKKINNGFDIDSLSDLSVDEARGKLKELKGIGEKVANCILLFSCGFKSAFPVDTWIKKTLSEILPEMPKKDGIIRQKVIELFGENAGYAQQILFHNQRIKSDIDFIKIFKID